MLFRSVKNNKDLTEGWLISSLNLKDLEQLKLKFIDYLSNKFQNRMEQFILFSSLDLDTEGTEFIRLLTEFRDEV